MSAAASDNNGLNFSLGGGVKFESDSCDFGDIIIEMPEEESQANDGSATPIEITNHPLRELKEEGVVPGLVTKTFFLSAYFHGKRTLIDCIHPKVTKYQNTKLVEYRNSTGKNILDCGTFI